MEIAWVCSNTGCLCVGIWVHQMEEMWCICVSWRMLVFVLTKRTNILQSHMCNIYICVIVRFRPGSLKPTRMWPRWVSSKPKCASSRHGSRCLSLESLISSPSRFHRSWKKLNQLLMTLYSLFYVSLFSFDLHISMSKWILFLAGSRVESGRSWSASLTIVWSGWMPALETPSRPGASATWSSGMSTGRLKWWGGNHM